MSKRKVIIIGAGISGLTAGCYLQMNGYETEIYEKHNIPGGLCTSWKRKDYTFDGCIHWLLGSAPGSPFHELWSELINLKNMQFVDHDLRVDIEVKNNKDKYGDSVFHLYADIDKLASYMNDIAPEDKNAINEFIASIRKLQTFELPPQLDKAPEVRNLSDKVKMVKYLPMLLYLKKWAKITNLVFADKLKNPFLKEAFELLFEGQEYSLLVMTMQLAYFDKKCAGYPIGGSTAFAKKFEESYLSLGGKIHYNMQVLKIVVENDTAVGIRTAKDQYHPADIIISAADGRFTIFDALEGKYTDKSIVELYEQKKLDVFDSAVLVTLGVSRTFSDNSHLLRFPLDEPLISPDGTRYDIMEAHIFNYDPTLAPKGKTVVSVTLTTRQNEYWTELRSSDKATYNEHKKTLAERVIEILDRKFGCVKEHIEVVDVATPATFERYTGNWKGSIQGWFPPKDLLSAEPIKKELPGLMNFYSIGHWIEPGGGLPPAIMSGRNVTQIICKKDNKPFVNHA